MTDFMSGLEYHAANAGELVAQLASIYDIEPLQWTDAKQAESNLLHEHVAYLNVMGQIYYALEGIHRFLGRDLTKLAPTLEQLIVFRMKHSAHRMIDFPKKDSDEDQEINAMNLSSLGMKLFLLRDPAGKPSNWWRDAYFYYQIEQREKNRATVLSKFCMELDHPRIIKETYACLESLLG